jgi:hypothetical protein
MKPRAILKFLVVDAGHVDVIGGNPVLIAAFFAENFLSLVQVIVIHTSMDVYSARPSYWNTFLEYSQRDGPVIYEQRSAVSAQSKQGRASSSLVMCS